MCTSSIRDRTRARGAQRKKFERDLRILELELAERPEHPFTLFNLGMTYVHAGRYGDAAGYLRRSIARSSPDESHLRKVYALLVYAEMRLGCRAEALETCRRGLTLFPHDVELRFREGVVLHELGRLEEARQAYSAVLTDGEERHFSSVDRVAHRIQSPSKPGSGRYGHGRPDPSRGRMARSSARARPATARAGAGWVRH